MTNKIKFKINDKGYYVEKEELEDLLVNFLLDQVESLENANDTTTKLMVKQGLSMLGMLGIIKKPKEFKEMSDLEYLVLSKTSEFVELLSTKENLQLNLKEDKEE